jgi:hypothetical protein
MSRVSCALWFPFVKLSFFFIRVLLNPTSSLYTLDWYYRIILHFTKKPENTGRKSWNVKVSLSHIQATSIHSMSILHPSQAASLQVLSAHHDGKHPSWDQELLPGVLTSSTRHM